MDLEDGEGLPNVNETASPDSDSPSGTYQYVDHYFSWNSINIPARITNELEIPDEIREEGIQLYFRHFHNQPFPLMMGMSDNPQASAAEYPKLVLFPLLAVSLRTCQNPFFRNKEAIAETCGMLAKAAWNLLAAQYAKFDFDLAYFQALCLLAQVDFASKYRPLHVYTRCACAETGPKPVNRNGLRLKSPSG